MTHYVRVLQFRPLVTGFRISLFWFGRPVLLTQTLTFGFDIQGLVVGNLDFLFALVRSKGCWQLISMVGVLRFRNQR